VANEVYVSAQGDTLAPSVFRLELEMLLHELPFMRRLAAYRGDTKRSNSDTIKVGQIDDDDIAAAVAEGSGVAANTAITDSSYSLAPGRQAIKRVLSNKLGFIDGTGRMRAAALAKYNFGAIMRRFDQQFATACASLTGTAGTSAAPFTASDWFTASQTLRSRLVRGKKAFLGAPQQFNDLQTDLRGEVGPWQLNEEVQAAVATTSGENLVASLNGIDLWTSSLVADANGGIDHNGAMFKIPEDSSADDGRYLGDAAIAYAEGSPDPVELIPGQVQMAPDGIVYTLLQLDADKAEIMMTTNYFVAAGVANASMGIKVITKHG
jgi:hypothetical protein